LKIHEFLRGDVYGKKRFYEKLCAMMGKIFTGARSIVYRARFKKRDPDRAPFL
jgi:hypothetical protein